MNLKEIKEMINLMNENSLTELELEREGLKIRLKKGPYGVAQEVIPIAGAPEVVHSVQPATAPSPKPPEAPPIKQVDIKAPMVGTFYLAPSPEAPPFVEVGHEIEEGQVICIIEAMKLMNEIKSEVKGKVVQILIENGDPVEFGQILFLIEPTCSPKS